MVDRFVGERSWPHITNEKEKKIEDEEEKSRLIVKLGRYRRYAFSRVTLSHARNYMTNTRAIDGFCRNTLTQCVSMKPSRRCAKKIAN